MKMLITLQQYVKEFAIRFREHSHMFCLDDKHRMKIGEPGFPVAAAERGRRVMVKVGSSFDVADHDFTKFSNYDSKCSIDEQYTTRHHRIMVSWEGLCFIERCSI